MVIKTSDASIADATMLRSCWPAQYETPKVKKRPKKPSSMPCTQKPYTFKTSSEKLQKILHQCRWNPPRNIAGRAGFLLIEYIVKRVHPHMGLHCGLINRPSIREARKKEQAKTKKRSSWTCVSARVNK
jgi:hypothetical protein